jgi:ABC-type uncharacterized transport system involved in gliding motility auxiliary subunit
VRFGGGPDAKVASYVVWLGLNNTDIDQRDVLAGEIKKLNFATAGILAKTADATTQFTPIVRTTASGMQLPSEAVSIMPDATALLRNYKAGGTPLAVVARVSGDAKSAFPDGPPPPPVDKSKDADKSKDKAPEKSEKSADKGADKGAKDKSAKDKGADKKGTANAKTPEKSSEKTADKSADTAEKKVEEKKTEPEPTKAPPAKHAASGKVNVIVVADTDFLHDQFWLEIREMLGQQLALPNAHNGAFVLAALENLTGSDALISLRGRGIADRPFDLVNDLRREAEMRFLNSELALTTRLKELRTKLANLQKEGGGDELVLSEKDHKEIEKFRAEVLATQRELRHVKRELRKDIDRLDGVLKFFNIAAVPLLIGLVSIGWAYRRRRPHGAPHAAEPKE